MIEVLDARQELNLSRTEFGRLVGVVRTTVMRWEKGQLTPSEPAIRLIRQLVANHRRGARRGAAA